MMDSTKQAFSRRAPYDFFFDLNLHFPQFLLNQTIVCVALNTCKYSAQQVYLNKALWAKFFLMFKLVVPTNLPYVVDGVQYKAGLTNWLVQFNTNTMMSDNRAAVYTLLPASSLALVSTSKTFASSVWLEREISDFTGINFLGLVDTRRLLLDYFEPKQVWQTHISNDKNFSNTLYDVFLVF